ncbi:hypothetical protein ACIBJF_05200 [Streptomyces sp. NPDC050743]|uniref:hypothetical protein n=1 Tax=Streptomyces sp. NPDC050743 TaxID=3365634 RepID=UPI00378A5278
MSGSSGNVWNVWEVRSEGRWALAVRRRQGDASRVPLVTRDALCRQPSAGRVVSR